MMVRLNLVSGGKHVWIDPSKVGALHPMGNSGRYTSVFVGGTQFDVFGTTFEVAEVLKTELVGWGEDR